MGGESSLVHGRRDFTRHRHQGRIEGSIEKLRAEREETPEKYPPVVESTGEGSPTMPPAPIALKRKRRLADESEDGESGLVRKLEFFEEKEVEGIAGRTKSRRNEDIVGVNQGKSKDEDLKKEEEDLKKVESVKRTSPRLSMRRSP